MSVLQAERGPGTRDEPSRVATVTVDLRTIASNWRTARAAFHGPSLGAVVKHDAYGLGLMPVAETLWRAGCTLFWVAWLEEALRLRKALPDAAIYTLNGLAGHDPAVFAANRIVPVLSSWSDVEAVAGAGIDGFPVAVMADGGLMRLGLTDDELRRLAGDAGLSARLDVRLWLTQLVHFARPGAPENAAQVSRLRAAIEPAGPSARLSVVSSSGVFHAPAFHFDTGRVGSALYGVQTSLPARQPVTPAFQISAPVLRVLDVPAGASIGYGGDVATRRPSRLATLAIGYGCGLPRTVPGRGHVAFDGMKAPYIGRLSMGLSAVDVTDLPAGAVREGTRAEIVGPSVPLEELADDAGTIGNDILIRLARGLPRIYR